MNIKEFISLIDEKYPLTELSSSPYEKMKVSGMSFNISSWKAEGLGHVSVMTATGFFGLMKMDTLIIVPVERDYPLLSYDRIKAMGNDTLLFELYDTLLSPFDGTKLKRVKEKYSSLPERDPGKHWYDNLRLDESVSKKSRNTASGDLMAGEYLSTFLSIEREKTSDIEKKKEKSAYYVDNLIKNGGPSTDVFKKKFGEEKTADLFRRVLFGTEE